MNAVCIGAHPDDCEVFAGGTAVKWARLGRRVLFVSMTNGDIGHYEMAGGALARRRAAEASLAAERAGVASLVLDHHDGELEPTLALRKQVVRIVREFHAEVVISHRTSDYHPDHRYTAEVVQDAAFMVTVPQFCPDVPVLERNPAFLWMMDPFRKPVPFEPDIAVAVDDVMDVKWGLLDAMESQVYEWLPWLDGTLETVPDGKGARRDWLRQTWDEFFRQPAKHARPVLERWYGKRTAAKVCYAELFEVSEYGHQPSEEEIKGLFPFFPKRRR